MADRAAFMEKSRELALELGQGIRREGRVFIVPSRTRSGLEHHVAWALDGELICNCEAASLGKRECWAVRAVREEIEMTIDERTETALVPVQMLPEAALLPTERTYSLIDRAAQMAFAGAIALPKELNTPQKIAAVMLYGYELGLKPMTAIQELYVVNGRVAPSARVMAGLFQARTDGRLSVVESTDKKCTMRLIWPSRKIDETWTVEWAEIERAKLAGRDVWATYPRDKLITHCTKRILRVFAPGVINGLVGPVIGDTLVEEDEDYGDDELYNPGDAPANVDRETGEIIDAEFTHGDNNAGGQNAATPAAASPAAPPASPPKSHDAVTKELQAVYNDLKGSTDDKAWLDELAAGGLQLAPETKNAYGSFEPRRVKPENAADLMAYLRMKQGAPPPPDEADEPPADSTPPGEPVQGSLTH